MPGVNHQLVLPNLDFEQRNVKTVHMYHENAKSFRCRVYTPFLNSCEELWHFYRRSPVYGAVWDVTHYANVDQEGFNDVTYKDVPDAVRMIIQRCIGILAERGTVTDNEAGYTLSVLASL